MLTDDDLQRLCQHLESRPRTPMDTLRHFPFHSGSVVTLIGSSKYPEDFRRWAQYFHLLGDHVFTLQLFGHCIENFNMNGNIKRSLDAAYMDKIEKSGVVMVVNDHHYIGLGTMDELLYAIALGKEVYFSEIPEPACSDAIIQIAYKTNPSYGASWVEHKTAYGVKFWELDYTW